MSTDEHLAELAHLVPREFLLVDQIEKLALLIVNRRLDVVEHDEIAAGHRCRVRLSAPMHAVGIGDGNHQLARLQPASLEYRLAGVGSAHDDIRALDDRAGGGDRLYFDVQGFGHFFGEAVAVLFGRAVDQDLVDRLYGANRFEVGACLVSGTE